MYAAHAAHLVMATSIRGNSFLQTNCTRSAKSTLKKSADRWSACQHVHGTKHVRLMMYQITAIRYYTRFNYCFLGRAQDVVGRRRGCLSRGRLHRVSSLVSAKPCFLWTRRDVLLVLPRTVPARRRISSERNLISTDRAMMLTFWSAASAMASLRVLQSTVQSSSNLYPCGENIQ